MALAEILREEEAPRASSPAPTGPVESAPDTLNLPGGGAGALSTPVGVPTPIQNGLPGLVSSAEIASRLFSPGGAQSRTVEAAEAKGRGMAPQIDTVTAAINAPAPTPPPAPVIGTPPPLGIRPFLASSEGESPIASLQKLVTGLGQFAIGLGGGSGRAKASLAALTGAMAGWQAGERERADRDFADWKANSDAALQTWNNQNKEYDNLLKARNLSLDEKMTGLKLAALKYDNDIAVAQLAENDLAKFLAYQTNQERDARNYELEVGKVLQAAENARLIREHQDRVLAETTRGHDLTAETARRGQDLTAGAKAQELALKARELDLKAAEAGPKLADVDRLRNQFLTQTQDFQTVRDNFATIRASAKDPSAAGDMSMLFAYMKVLDPKSVVRESEYATAANAGGVDDRTRALWNRLIDGQRMSASIRNDYLDRAQSLYNERLKSHENMEGQFRQQARMSDISPDRIVVDIVGDLRKAPPLVEPLSRKSEKYKAARAKGLDDETISARFNLKLTD